MGDSATLDKTYISVSAILVFNSDGRISFVNEQAAALLNYSPADVIGCKISELFHSAGEILTEEFWSTLLRELGHNLSARLNFLSETQWLVEFFTDSAFHSLMMIFMPACVTPLTVVWRGFHFIMPRDYLFMLILLRLNYMATGLKNS
ncbi:PAS domain-containing protein [Aliamphritea spongicola]